MDCSHQKQNSISGSCANQGLKIRASTSKNQEIGSVKKMKRQVKHSVKNKILRACGHKSVFEQNATRTGFQMYPKNEMWLPFNWSVPFSYFL